MDWREQGWKGTHRTTEKHAEETTFTAKRTVLTHWLAHLLLPLVARCIWVIYLEEMLPFLYRTTNMQVAQFL
jgi:hypothetical protein